MLNELLYTSSSNKKIDIIIYYLNSTPLEDRGFGIALLNGDLKFNKIKNSSIKEIIKDKIDSYLFDLSYDYVGDLAETIALIWENKSIDSNIPLNILVKKLESKDLNIKKFVCEYLNNFSVDQRWAFIKLLLGGLRVGVSAKIVKKALSIYGNKQISDIEKIWNGLEPPYNDLFDWLDNKKPIPQIDQSNIFHPLMLAYSIDEEKELNNIDLDQFYVEYKWDGIRVQVVVKENKTKIFSRGGEEISKSFPEISIEQTKLCVLDGELLVGKDYVEMPFNELQKRINKKKPSKKLLSELPAFIRIYDILFFMGKDIRNEKLITRKNYLLDWYNSSEKNCFDISPVLKFKNLTELKKQKQELEHVNIEGFMIKNKNSCYQPGRKKGLWYKWKRDPKLIDAILMYAQRGHGKRSSYYSDYTFGVWNENELVPITKAYSGYTDKELNKIDNFVRNNTTSKFGPVREIKKKLVMEIAFDAINISKRHKSGVALRFPRINRIRWDKPVKEVMDISKIKEEFFKI